MTYCDNCLPVTAALISYWGCLMYSSATLIRPSSHQPVKPLSTDGARRLWEKTKDCGMTWDSFDWVNNCFDILYTSLGDITVEYSIPTPQFPKELKVSKQSLNSLIFIFISELERPVTDFFVSLCSWTYFAFIAEAFNNGLKTDNEKTCGIQSTCHMNICQG